MICDSLSPMTLVTISSHNQEVNKHQKEPLTNIAIIPVHNLVPRVSFLYRDQRPNINKTYHRPLEVFTVLLQFPHGVCLIRSSFHEFASHRVAQPFEDTPELVLSGRRLRDLQLEVGSLSFILVRVICGLVFGGGFTGLCGRLFEEGQGPHGGLEGGLVEEGDDIEGFLLHVEVQ